MYDNLINKLRIGAKCFPGWKLYGYAKEPYSLMPEDLEQAADAIEGLELCCKNFEEALKELDEKLDEVEQKKGEWERNDDGIMIWWECSECHHDAWYDREELTNYCPNCGAKMEAEVNHE